MLLGAAGRGEYGWKDEMHKGPEAQIKDVPEAVTEDEAAPPRRTPNRGPSTRW